jgi:hypothetical protein
MKLSKIVLKPVEMYVPYKEEEETVDGAKVREIPVGWFKRLERNLNKYKKTREGIEKFLATPKKEKVVKQ